MGSVSFNTSGNTSSMTWGGAPSTVTSAGLTFTFSYASWSFAGNSSSPVAGTGTTPTYTIGYSTTASGSVSWYYSRSGHADIVGDSASGSTTTGPQPITNKQISASVSGIGPNSATISVSASCSGGNVVALAGYLNGSVAGSTSTNGPSASASFPQSGLNADTQYSYSGTATFSDNSGIAAGTSYFTTQGPYASVSFYSSGPYAYASWTASGSTTITSVTIAGSTYNPGNQSGSYSVYVGYSASWSGSATDNYGRGYNGSGNTPIAPPAAPATPVLSVAPNTTQQPVLTWTGSANGFNLSRSLNADMSSPTAINNVTSPYTDTAAPVQRPIYYTVQGYNSNSSGTTYSAVSNTASLAPTKDAIGVLLS